MFELGAVCAILTLLPIIFRHSVFAWLSCIPTGLTTWLLFRAVYFHRLNSTVAIPYVAISLSLLSDVVVLVIMRQSLRWMLARTELPQMALAILVQLLLLCAIFALPGRILFAASPVDPKSKMAIGGLMLAIFNFPTAIACASFLVLLSIVFLHRVTWPILSKWSYVLTRNDVLEKRGLARSVGSFLILFGLRGLVQGSVIYRIAERLLR